MRKHEELTNPHSCLNRAGSHEMLFTLLSRDITAPMVIAHWIELRLALGLNDPNDKQITEARETVRTMIKEKDTRSNFYIPPTVDYETEIKELKSIRNRLQRALLRASNYQTHKHLINDSEFLAVIYAAERAVCK